MAIASANRGPAEATIRGTATQGVGRHVAPEIEYIGYREHWAQDTGGGGWAYPERKLAYSFLVANFKFKPVSAP